LNSRKLTITTWEYSWLTRRKGEEREFANWNKALDEAVKRKYNCIRIDPFPQLFLSKQKKQEILAMPAWNLRGCHSDIQINIHEDLLDFLSVCREKRLKVGLSGWLVRDKEGLFKVARSKDGLLVMWLRLLKFLRENDLLDVIEWIDPINEWPMSYPDPGKNLWLAQFRRGKLVQWTNDFLKHVLKGLKREFPDMKYTFSFGIGTFPRQKEKRKLDLSGFDLLELHAWLTDYRKYRWGTWHELYGFSKMLPWKFSIDRFAKKAKSLFYKNEVELLDYLQAELQSQAEWAKELGIPLYISEGFITLFYENGETGSKVDVWEWYRDATEKCHSIAIGAGPDGLCTSNFSEPLFKMWDEPRWHEKLNENFLNK